MKKNIGQDASDIMNEIDYAHAKCVEAIDAKNASHATRDFSSKLFCAYVAYSSDGNDKTIYITKGIPPHEFKPQNNCKYASYYSPYGRIASLDMDSPDDIETPGGDVEVTVKRKNLFRSRTIEPVDAVDNTYFDGRSVYTLKSLRATLKEYIHIKEVHSNDKKPVDFEVELIASKLINDFVTDDIKDFSMREQAILDNMQDKVLRARKTESFVLVGPPGTGKTTTLIKKISFLTNKESTDNSPYTSWTLYSPNALFSAYVKEAMGADGLPASQDTVKEWASEKETLARDVFNFIGPSSITCNTKDIRLVHNRDIHTDETRELFRNINAKLAAQLNLENANLAESLSKARDLISSTLSAGMDIMQRHGTPFRDKAYNQIAEELRYIFTISSPLSHGLKHTAESPKSAINHIVSSVYSSVSEDSSKFKTKLLSVKAGLIKNFEFYIHSGLVKVSKHTGNSQQVPFTVENYLKANGFNKLEEEIKANTNSAAKDCCLLTVVLLRILNGLLNSWFLGPPKRFFTHLCDCFIELNSDRAENSSMEVVGLELDVLLSFGIEYLSIRIDQDATVEQHISKFNKHRKDIIALDEFSDFSPVEIFCMTRLMRSGGCILLSGDLLQRSTSYGIKSLEQIKKIVPNITVCQFLNIYRMAEPICNIASSIYNNSLGLKLSYVGKHKSQRFFPPAYHKFGSNENRAEWIANQIVQLYSSYEYLPSIAILCSDLSSSNELHSQLQPILHNQSIPVSVSSGYGELGRVTSVRIFQLSDIKGLEFEGVIIHKLDDIYNKYEDISENYIYIAATRASRYIGFTTSGEVPTSMAYILQHFQLT